MVEADFESQRRVLLLAGDLEVRGRTMGLLRLAELLPDRGYLALVACSNRSRVSARQRRDLEILEYGGLDGHLMGSLVRRFLAHDLADVPPDLVHVQSLDLVPVAEWLSQKWGVPVVVSVSEVQSGTRRLRRARQSSCVARVLAVSQAVADSLVDLGGVSADRIVVVPSGVAVPRVDRLVSVLDPEHVPVFGTAGPLETIKGLPYFLGAAQKVLAAGRDAEFLVAGSGPEEDNLRRLAGELGIRERVTFLPNRPDFSDALGAVDVFCLPSLQQGLGTIMLEAMSLGRPVIASDVGGIYSVVRDGETGLAVTPEDSGQLARQMIALLDDPVRARALGEAGRIEVTERFGVERMIDQVVEVYDGLLQTDTSNGLDTSTPLNAAHEERDSR